MENADSLLTRLNARLVSIGDGVSSVQLFIPDTETVRAQFEASVTRNPTARFPFWARLWPSSIALAEYIREHAEFFVGKSVLEVAGGLGLPSLTAAPFSKSLLFTDIDPAAVAVFSKVAILNDRFNAQADLLDWNFFPREISADILLLSDVNYDAQSFTALQGMIKRFIESGSLVLLSTPMRLVGRSFIEPLLPLVFDQQVRPVVFEDIEYMISVMALKASLASTSKIGF